MNKKSLKKLLPVFYVGAFLCGSAPIAFATSPYRIYSALLTQTGTDDPIAIVLENNLVIITLSRVSEGNYTLSTNLTIFDVNKTIINLTQNIINSNATTQILDSSNINISTDEDNRLNKTPIEIRVYQFI